MQSGSTGRIAGWLLLVMGTVLVLSIAWAAIGFLFLSVGLICLLTAEKKRKLKEANLSPDPAVEVVSSQIDEGHGRQFETGVASHFRSEINTGLPPPNQHVWPILTELDPNIHRLAVALAPYGQKFVDKLAVECLDAADARQFPEIGRKIVAAALESLDRARKAEEEAQGNPGRRLLATPSGDTRGKASQMRTARPLVQIAPPMSARAEAAPLVRSGSDTLDNEAVAVQAGSQGGSVAVIAVKVKPPTSVGHTAARAISSRPNTQSSREPAPRVQSGPTDDDDLKDMAEILDHLNGISTTRE